MRRITNTTFPSGGGSEGFSYSDSTPSFTFTKQIAAGVAFTETGILDHLGRQVRTDTLVPTTTCLGGHVYVDTSYDDDGRQMSASNSYCTTGDSTYGITTSYYDVLNRVTKTVPPDGTLTSNNVATSHSGNVTTVTDEAGNQRRSYFDVLGRFVRVDEPASTAAIPGSGSATIGGSEHSTTNGTPGRGSATVNGSEQSQYFAATQATGWVNISGELQWGWVCWDDGNGNSGCDWGSDFGTIVVYVNGIYQNWSHYPWNRCGAGYMLVRRRSLNRRCNCR